MTAPLFLVAQTVLARVGVGASLRLDGPEGHHAATVRRIGVGERVDLADGQGVLAEAVVIGAARDELELKVLVRGRVAPPSPRLVVVQAVPKGDRGELAVELLTEVGVDVVVPWAAARCVAAWRGERGERALRRWRETARAAGKQSRRALIPQVAPLASTVDVVGLLRGAAAGIVLHEGSDASLTSVNVPAAGELVLVVGPEGGLTDRELAVFAAAGAGTYRLGPSVLRTSTAGVVAAGILLARSSRWR